MGWSLAPLDASFLLLERRWAPMHFGGLSIIDPSSRPEGPITLEELQAVTARRLRRLPRLVRRPAFHWHGLAHPVWEPSAMDPRRQVQGHVLPGPGGDAELLHLVGLLHAEPLDHTRPLWELHLIDGLASGRQATVMKIHHSVADGIGGMEVAEALFDRRPGARRRQPVHPAAAGPPWLVPLQMLLGTGQVVAALLSPFAPLFTGSVGPRRAFGYATLPAAEILEAKRRLGVTVDDVLLEIVATGLRRHLMQTAVEPPPKMRVMVPISTRIPGLDGANHVTAMFFDLSLEGEPEAIAASAEARKTVLRHVHEGAALGALVQASGLLPEPLRRPVVRLVTGRPMFNAVVSDIPGPDLPYSLLGARVEAMYPLMPLAPTAGLSIAALWVGGVVGIGVTSDPSRLPDPHGLAGEIRQAAAELRPRGRSPRPAPARTGRRSGRRYARSRPAASASESASARPRPR